MSNYYKANWIEVTCMMVGFLFICVLFVLLFADEIPSAAHAETLNQRHIAAKSINHMVGYYEYKQFTQNNQ